ncbi:uroporphyrinogen-III C-methyltransferase [Pseudotenacibaculum sp. MALMAid0570]|uniref:uroporphyrinogen-III C-methyltransferase n=1 Tax=Pseudotenacibaculum sp. MALMAid0570 TaxID=3143938 RepID=UPI0032DE7A8B
MSRIKPKLTLVGAGPGDPDLITVKGVKSLAKADVVMYDALANDDLLAYAKNAKKIFVGKRKGYKRYSQQRINELIVENAFNYGHVVRLKGGDPFVFGRGSEEIEYADSFGIPIEVVSGISSSVAVPAKLGIAVTQRNVSRSFWVLTGTDSNNELAKDVSLAAKSSATIVILMGMSKLSKIINLFQQEGKGEVPIAIIQNGTLPNEKVGIGVINTIEEQVALKQLSSPAIIIIGDVVKKSHQLRSFYQEIQPVQSSPFKIYNYE